jgi:putative ABC transport system permease protein
MLGKDRTGHLEEEIKEHAELLAAEYVARGMTESEARYAARRELGNISSLRQEYREQKGLPVLENIWQDLKYAVRTLRRNRIFTASCTATLAVGLGSMITVLCIVSAILWKPLPYQDPERLVVLKEVDPGHGLWSFSEPDFLDVQERSTSFAALAAYRPASVAMTGAGEPETIQAAAVTPSSFAIFGIKPVVGQVFHDSQKYVVISRGLWKRKWQTNPDVVGQAVALDGESYSISGVADLPADVLPGAELLLPLLPKTTESRTAHEVEAVGRLSAGVDKRQAQAQLNNVAASIARENATSNAGWGMQLVPLSDYVVGPRTGRTVWMIFAAVALLWVLACANVAGLQLSRSIARKHEMSTRQALGASRLRIFAQTLTENFVLALMGTTLGAVIALYVLEAVQRLAAGSLPRMAHLQMDATTIEMALGFMVLSMLLFTLLSHRSPSFERGREVSRRDGGRDALIVVQVALASVLLLCTSLLFQSFLRLEAVDPGFDPEKLLTIRVNLSGDAGNNLRRVSFFREAAERLSHLPEVESVGATNVAPFSGSGTANRFRLEGEPRSAEFRSAAWRAVTPEFFETLGIPLKSGRRFTAADVDGSQQVVILSESMAKRFWPNQDPIGRQLLWGRSGSVKTIVGVVGDLRDLSVDASPVPTMFRPFAQLPDAPMTFVIRTKTDPAGAIADARREIWAIDRNAALEFEPLRQAMSDSILRPRFSLLALAAFAVIAMITAALGLYGQISYRVSQRQQEIGIRLALGCPAASVRWGVQRRCLILVGSGLAIGLPAAYALARLMTSLLYETHPTEARAYAMVLLVFGTVALAASYGPARRASRMDPLSAIRHE